MPDFRVISVACPAFEPPEIYVNRISQEHRERAPRLVRRWMRAAADRVEGYGVGTGTGYPGGSDPRVMLRAIDQQGIWGSVLQPTLGLNAYHHADSALLTEFCRIYNDWISDYCQANPRRLKGLAMLNVDDVDVASTELYRAAKLGLVGAFIPSAPQSNRPYSHIEYDKLWAAAETAAIPLLLHVGTEREETEEGAASIDPMAGTLLARASGVDEAIRRSLTEMIAGGVFDRFPGVKVGSVGNSAAWVPQWLDELDEHYFQTEPLRWTKLKMRPRDYWYRNLFAEFSEDPAGVELRNQIGIDNMVWGGICQAIRSGQPDWRQLSYRFAGIPQTEWKKITCDNAARMFGFADDGPAEQQAPASTGSIGLPAGIQVQGRDIHAVPLAIGEYSRLVNASNEDGRPPVVSPAGGGRDNPSAGEPEPGSPPGVRPCAISSASSRIT